MIRQLARFGIVGFSAMGVHLLCLALLVRFALHPLLANVIAFLVAFQVSYWGHKSWTFEAHEGSHAVAMQRFFVVAVSSFCLNELLYCGLLRFTALHYLLAQFIVLLLVAVLTFILSRLWAFRTA